MIDVGTYLTEHSQIRKEEEKNYDRIIIRHIG
jgi:hypothetical protein